MHQIKTSIRKILPRELPTVTPIGEATRPMNEEELLNAGLVPLGSDFYSCIAQHQRDDETMVWKPVEGQDHPGTVISEGSLKERHEKLPSEARDQIMRARVTRTVKGKKGMPDATATIHVAHADVKPGDQVEQTDIPPHSWAGESKR